MADAKPDESFEKALALALARLRRSDAFESEIRALLVAKGSTSEASERVIRRLREQKLLDDRQTAQRWVASRISKRAEGLEPLRNALIERGAPADCIESALADYDEAERRLTMADLLRSRFGKPQDRARAGRLLIARGFEEDEVESALAAHFGLTTGMDDA